MQRFNQLTIVGIGVYYLGLSCFGTLPRVILGWWLRLHAVAITEAKERLKAWYG